MLGTQFQFEDGAGQLRSAAHKSKEFAIEMLIG